MGRYQRWIDRYHLRWARVQASSVNIIRVLPYTSLANSLHISYCSVCYQPPPSHHLTTIIITIIIIFHPQVTPKELGYLISLYAASAHISRGIEHAIDCKKFIGRQWQWQLHTILRYSTTLILSNPYLTPHLTPNVRSTARSS